MPTIYHQLIIQSPIAKVYDAITSQEGLSQWWIADCIARPELGFVNEFKVGMIVHNKMKIIDLQENRRVEWLCELSAEDWIGTHVIFELTDKGDATVVDFKQTEWREVNSFFATCNYHWGRHLSMLKELCEAGSVERDPKKEMEEIIAAEENQ